MPKKNEMKTAKSSGSQNGRKPLCTSSDPAASPQDSSKSRNPAGDYKSNGLVEIDSLFSEKKRLDRQEKQATKKRKHSSHGSVVGTDSKRRDSKSDKSILDDTFCFSAASATATTWVDDGLGGKFNREGFTGRVEDGIKIFKAHVLNKPGSGQGKDCPFDCDCCFI
jgi:hypothetical protein